MKNFCYHQPCLTGLSFCWLSADLQQCSSREETAAKAMCLSYLPRDVCLPQLFSKYLFMP